MPIGFWFCVVIGLFDKQISSIGSRLPLSSSLAVASTCLELALIPQMKESLWEVLKTQGTCNLLKNSDDARTVRHGEPFDYCQN